MGMKSSDIRIFYSNRARSWIITNDYKLRRLMAEGYSFLEAKEKSHGHMANESLCQEIKRNILSNKRTKSRDLWVLGCYVRVSDHVTYKHYSWVCGLYTTRNNKDKRHFINVGGRKR